MKAQRLQFQDGFDFNIKVMNVKLTEKESLKTVVKKKILPIKYTPDFVSDSFIIECKGRANESFPLRWKMFKKYLKAHTSCDYI